MMLRVSAKQIEEAIEALAEGKVIVFPTETSYGLGADATNDAAVAAIFAIKGRDEGKGLPVLIPKGTADQFVQVNDAAKVLMDAHWPGALNIILPRTNDSKISERCSTGGTQSVRVTSHPFTSILVERFGKPITATSANVSGKDALYSVAEAQKAFEDRDQKPDVVIDAGELPVLPASTTVLVEGNDVRVIRQGSVSI